MVKNGQTLFQIDPRPSQVQLDEASAALASSRPRAHATAEIQSRPHQAACRAECTLEKGSGQCQRAVSDDAGRRSSGKGATGCGQTEYLSYTTIKSPVNGLAGSGHCRRRHLRGCNEQPFDDGLPALADVGEFRACRKTSCWICKNRFRPVSSGSRQTDDYVIEVVLS